MKKIIVIALLLLAASFLAWQIYEKISLSEKSLDRRRRNVSVAVELSPIGKASIQDIGKYTGSLYPLSEFILAPKIAGRLDRIRLNIGDTVKGGQLAAIIEDEEYRQQVSQAKAEIEVTRANLQEQETALEKAKREYDRTVALRKKQIASASQLDTAASEFKAQQAKLKVAYSRVAQSEAALNVANARLAYTQIHVPDSNGNGYRVVGERFVDEGAMLSPNTPIVSILDIGKLIAAIHVIERDYPKIKKGFKAVISTDAHPGRSFHGKVARIAPLFKEKSREARVEIEIPNRNRLLKPGMFVRVEIGFQKHAQATVVPLEALVKRNSTQGVFLVDRDKKTARFIPVTTGIVNNGVAEILDPQISGHVVVLGHHLLEDGGSIILPDQQPGGSTREKKSTDDREKP
jgi:RND family efflux transporter MFP subunit